jgi:hypothetical protein
MRACKGACRSFACRDLRGAGARPFAFCLFLSLFRLAAGGKPLYFGEIKQPDERCCQYQKAGDNIPAGGKTLLRRLPGLLSALQSQVEEKAEAPGYDRSGEQPDRKDRRQAFQSFRALLTVDQLLALEGQRVKGEKDRKDNQQQKAQRLVENGELPFIAALQAIRFGIFIHLCIATALSGKVQPASRLHGRFLFSFYTAEKKMVPASGKYRFPAGLLKMPDSGRSLLPEQKEIYGAAARFML